MATNIGPGMREEREEEALKGETEEDNLAGADIYRGDKRLFLGLPQKLGLLFVLSMEALKGETGRRYSGHRCS